MLASACECSRLCASARVCVRLCASACVCVHLSRVCVRLCVSVCVCVRRASCLASVVLSRVGRLVSRMCASACGNWLILCISRHSKSSKVGELAQVFAICLTSVCVCSRQGFRMLASVCVCVRLSHVGRLVSRHSKSLKVGELAHFIQTLRFCYHIIRLSYYPLAVFCERVLFFFFFILI